jgi:hypothetical protein
MDIPVRPVRVLLGVSMILMVCDASFAQAPQLPSAPPSGRTPAETRIEELERRVRELESRLLELEGARANRPPAVVAETVPPDQPPPAAAAATSSAEQSSISQTGPISGYMDFHFNKPEHEDAQLDFHRFVLLFNHSFSDRLRFVGELELEHALVAGLEPSGELELEQAYLDFKVNPAFNIRAGMVLAPVGIINERHEPPSFHGVERPFVDTFIIPTTWFDAGAGIHGTFGAGWQYRAYLMAPLDATRITADEGLHEARQKGFVSNVRDVAQTGRLEYAGFPGLTLGASFWRGKTGFNFRRVDSRVGVAEFDGRYHRGPFAIRGEFAQVFIDGAADLNDVVQRAVGVNPNIARQMRGFYVEPSIRPLPRIRHDLAAFVRYENFDTQFRMPAGVLALKQFDRAAWVVGGSYFPDPDVVLKVDYSVIRNRSSLFRSVDALNIGLGWWF